MKKKRFSVEQIVSVLKQAELGLPVSDLVRQFGIFEQTFHRWKKPYAGLAANPISGIHTGMDQRIRRAGADPASY